MTRPLPARSFHGEWSSRWAFILAATGSAVGLGNIWKFPYITGEHGGGAFVLVYLACIACVGLPVMMAEILIGRRGRQNPVHTLETLAVEAGARPEWRWLGGLGVVAGFLILSYYSVIAGQAIAYVFRVFSGTFEGVTADGAHQLYQRLVRDPERLLAWHTLFMMATMLIVSRGVNRGLERAVRFFVPALLIILVILVGYAMSTGPYFLQGMRFLFQPDFSQLSRAGFLAALGHAFFTLSLGMGAIMVYGSYLSRKASIFKVSVTITALDTGIALVAGMAIFPLVFAHGLTPSMGPGLIFETLPIAFGHMAAGTWFGGLFFVLLVFAALSSAIALIEPAVIWGIEQYRLSRIQACFIAGIVTWLLGLLTILSFNIGADWRLADKNAFEWLDFLSSSIMLPLGGLLIAVFCGWMMRPDVVRAELAMRHPLGVKLWHFGLRYITPIAILVVFANVVGWVR